ncbi:unnamed protein product [Closterium sp. NIES-65]|nr:unnamed protein product [Closterium sp. NIES-65]
MDIDADSTRNATAMCPPDPAAPNADDLSSPQTATAREQREPQEADDAADTGCPERESPSRSSEEDLVVSLTRRGEEGTQRLVEAAEGVLSTLNLVMCNGAFWEASSETAGAGSASSEQQLHQQEQQQRRTSGLPPDAAAAAIEMAHLRYKNISSELRSLLLRLQEEMEKGTKQAGRPGNDWEGTQQGPDPGLSAPDAAHDHAAPEEAPEAAPEALAAHESPSVEELTARAATLRKQIKRCNMRLRAAMEALRGISDNGTHTPPSAVPLCAPPASYEIPNRSPLPQQQIKRCNVRLKAAMEALRGILDDVTLFQAPQLLLLSQS